MVGNFLAFDKHMNAVISDTEEFRKVKPKRAGELEREQKRMLGMVLIRGENVVSITAEAPPPPQARRPGESLVIGKAKAEKAISGVPLDRAPPGLAGPTILGGPPPAPVSIMLNAPGRAPPARPPPPAFNP